MKGVFNTMTLRFDEVEHKYYLGDKELISTTTLLSKHGLSVDYSNVPEPIMERARQRGNKEHKNIEMGLKGEANIHDLSDFAIKSIETLGKHKITVLGSEIMAHNDIVAGTIDIIGLQDGLKVMVDIKTTYKIHMNTLRWQLSVYSYLHGGVDKLYCLWHNRETNKAELVDVEFIPTEKVERLLECERLGIIYTEYETNEIMNFKQSEIFYNQIKLLEYYKNFIVQLESELKPKLNELASAMSNSGIKKIENDDFNITYVAPQERVSYDYKQFLKDNGLEIPDSYKKITKVKEHVKIKTKEKEK